MNLRDDLRERLIRYGTTATGPQQDIVRDFITLLDQPADPFSRESWGGHITASAFVTNREHDEFLLVKHRKLGIWLQPGGHVEASDDATVLDAALREVAEETGLGAIPLLDGAIFDLDIHEIPAHGTAPAHLHYDVRFLVEAIDGSILTISSESTDMRWFTPADLARFPLHPSQQRLAKELVKLVAAERQPIPAVQWMTG